VHTADDDSGRERADDLPADDLPVDPDAPRDVVPAKGPRTPRVLRERWDVLLVIAAGGAVGSVGRWALSEALPHGRDGVGWATWLENVSGAFVLGVLMVLVLDYWPPHRYVRPFVGVGVLGGFTTFSTYMLDTRALLAAGRAPAAAGYLFGTLLTGLAAVWVGVLVARGLVAALEHRRRSRSEHTGEQAGDEPPAGVDPETSRRGRR
jgi:fluoride exporter